MTETRSAKVIERVKWPEIGCLGGDMRRYEKMKAVVGFFCELGTVTGWDRYGSGHFPTSYEIEGIQVLYHPLCYGYSIRAMKFELPNSKDDIVKVVRAVQVLQGQGLHF